MEPHRYLVALGSNVRHPRHGSPTKVLAAALNALAVHGVVPVEISHVITSAPLGPSRRRYANAVAVVETAREPEAVLSILNAIEYDFGRRRRGQAWGSRVLDLDIVLWSGGAYASAPGTTDLVIPHRAFRERRFVLDPAARIAGTWRDPLTGLSIRQLRTRLTKPRSPLRWPPIDTPRAIEGP